MNEEIVKQLMNIGFTQNEARTYTELLELKEAQTGLLCDKLKIPSSHIYRILNSLIKKGVISYKIVNNIKVFMSAPPEILNELFLEKQKKLEEERKKINELVLNLKKREPEKETYSNYKYYEGMIGIKAMWHEINSIMDKEIIIKAYTAKKESYERFVGFYTEHHKLRKQKQVMEKLIFPKEDIKLAKKRKDKFTEIKFMDLKNDAEWGILKNTFYVQYITGKTPRGFLIHDAIFAKTFESVFDHLWKIAKN
jgi:sugar-specific transcriptional regulator TrmB